MAYGNHDNTFVALIDQNGFIRDMSTGRRGEVIGVDYQKEEEYKSTIAQMQETIDNYYTKLVELGAIEIPKSPEVIAQEATFEQLKLAQEQAAQQAEINKALLDAIENLSTEVKEMKAIGGRGGYVNGFGNEQNRHNSEADREIDKPSKSRIAAGTKASA